MLTWYLKVTSMCSCYKIGGRLQIIIWWRNKGILPGSDSHNIFLDVVEILIRRDLPVWLIIRLTFLCIRTKICTKSDHVYRTIITQTNTECRKMLKLSKYLCSKLNLQVENQFTICSTVFHISYTKTAVWSCTRILYEMSFHCQKVQITKNAPILVHNSILKLYNMIGCWMWHKNIILLVFIYGERADFWFHRCCIKKAGLDKIGDGKKN